MASRSTRIVRIVNRRIAPASAALIRALGAVMFTFARAIPSHTIRASTRSRFKIPMPAIPLAEPQMSPSGPASTHARFHGRNRSIRYRTPAPSKILLAVDILDRSNPPACDMALLSTLPQRSGTRLTRPHAGSLSDTPFGAESNMRRLVLASPSSSRERPSGGDESRHQGSPRPDPRRGELRWPEQRERRGRDHEGTGDRQEQVPRRSGVPDEPARDRQREAHHGGARGDHRPRRRATPRTERLGPGPEPAPWKDRCQHGDGEGEPRERA